MRVSLLSIFILVLFGSSTHKKLHSDDFTCLISANKLTYKLGETPKIAVEITNNSKEDVYLIGSLDGSEKRWRSPYSFYEIDKPQKDRLPVVMHCGNMNSLRVDDFKLVKANKSFNPYESINHYGFFKSFEINRKENFRLPGNYKVTFYYSTKSKDLEDYLGDGEESVELRELFDQVPNIYIKSNTLEFEIVE